MNNLNQELIKIRDYIAQTYQLKTEIKLEYDNKKSLYVYAKKYDLRIRLTDKTEKNYLNGHYGIDLYFDANKKIQKRVGVSRWRKTCKICIW